MTVVQRCLAVILLVGTMLVSAVARAEDVSSYVVGGASFAERAQADFLLAPSLQMQLLPASRFSFTPTGSELMSGGSQGAISIGVDLPVGSGFVFTPSFAAGRYDSRSGIEPDGRFEFRSGAALSYMFFNDWRVGAALYHITDNRPATEKATSDVVTFTFSVPFGN